MIGLDFHLFQMQICLSQKLISTTDITLHEVKNDILVKASQQHRHGLQRDILFFY
jgi:hypothetical protein